MRDLQRKGSPLLKIITRKEDQAMGPVSGIATKILTTELILIMDRIIRIVDDHSTKDQINFPLETLEID